MRWSYPIYKYDKKFTFFPISINGEYRWLETVYIKQERHLAYVGYQYSNKNFITKKEYLEKKEIWSWKERTN